MCKYHTVTVKGCALSVACSKDVKSMNVRQVKLNYNANPFDILYSVVFSRCERQELRSDYRTTRCMKGCEERPKGRGRGE